MRTRVFAFLHWGQDAAITVVLWTYYILGFLLFFSPFYLYALWFPARREEAFQKWNHRLHRSFFALVGALVPGVQWRISREVRELRSSVIIANHLSFLDPILLVSLFEKQKTIVKNDYFKFPVFGWILRNSGYIPSQAGRGGVFSTAMIDQIKSMQDFLSAGGNLFIFPEGTRSRDGRLGPFDKGAFKIARLCEALSIKVIEIRNTDRLFPPDRFLLNTREKAVIEVTMAGSVEAGCKRGDLALSAWMEEARALLERKAGS